MNQEILDAVAKALPKMQADVLHAELKKASEHQHLTSRVAELAQQLHDAKLDAARLSLIVKKDEELKARELEVQNKLRQLEIDLLKKDVQCANLVTSNVKELAMAAFRNPTVYKSYNKTIPDPNANYQGATIDVRGNENTSIE